MNKMKTKLIAMMMAGVMVFAMAPLGAGVAFAAEGDEGQPVAADEETPIVDEEEPVVEEEAPVVDEEAPVAAEEAAAVNGETGAAAETEGAVEAKAVSPYIYASDILNYPGLLDANGYLKLNNDIILYIDTDCTINGINGDARTYDYEAKEWVGPIYNLTIRGDEKHKLTIEADRSNNYSVQATDINMESGNVFINMTAGFGIYAHQNFNMKGGSFEMTIADSAQTWSPFYAENALNISGGTLKVDNNIIQYTNGALGCMEFNMTGGTVNAIAEQYGMGLWVHDKTVISGGSLNLTGTDRGLNADGTFEMTGGSVTACALNADPEYTRAFDFDQTAPIFGTNVKITEPEGGKIGTYKDYYTVVNKDGSNAKKGTIKYVAPTVKPTKKANTMTLKGKTVKIKYKKLKKKAQSFAISKVLTVTRAQGKVTYKKVSGNKKISIASNGTVTVKKRLKKGSYKVTVKVTAAGNKYFKNATKTVTFTINVKKK